MQLLLAQPILDLDPTKPQTTQPTLAIVLVGANPASETYVSIKLAKAMEYGVNVQVCRFNDSIQAHDLKVEIKKLNEDKTVNALIVQLPLPAHIPTFEILDCIAPEKDVDNLTGQTFFTSPMVLAIQALKNYYNLNFTSKKLCVIGQGRLVGKPVRQWLEQEGFKPEIVYKHTARKNEIIQNADITFAGSGHSYSVDEHNTREGQIIFDCSGYDVDFEAIKEKVAAITPPKGGIGPLTVHFLLKNVLASSRTEQ